MADQLPGLFERCILDHVSQEEIEFNNNYYNASPISHYDDAVTHLTPPLVSASMGGFKTSISTANDDVPLVDLDPPSVAGSNYNSSPLSQYEDALTYITPQLASFGVKKSETGILTADNDVPLLDLDSSTSSLSDYNLFPGMAPPDLPSATAQIGNVAAASILHQDQEYVNGLRDCCVHTLHGSRNCPKPNICSGRLLLCKDFQIGACPVTEFQHGLYIHIKKNCKSAIVTSECFVFDCQSGHDYFELRQERWEEYVHKRKIDAEIGKTLKRALMSKAVHQQLDTLARAITSNATTPLPSNVISAAKNLRRKLESEYDGEQILQGDLKVEVIAALQAYDNLVRLRLQNQQALLQTASKPNQPIQLQHNQFKEQTQAPARVTTVGEGSNRTNLDNATCRQIETLERAMGNQTTPLDRIQAQGAAGKLRRKLRSKMGTGEKVIKNNLKGKVWNTLAAYNEWAKHAS